ncbi:winged helix-turn-helix transcriptional regulator [Halomicrobium katesii]|uniref:winged helix-turn-helix transcriptional regulator n=1 Tax=Halomicrobium katesii TaxID=437163 RepID=UPI000366EE1A|nr:helix-turn-helix domain-containing protein [Halomicrobium katesii]
MSSTFSPEPDETCQVVESFDLIGSKWRLAVLYELLDGEQRFNELKRETGTSSRTLSRVLDDLQDRAFVDRRVEEAAPVATYYTLTEKGEALAPVFEKIGDWADEWLDDAVATPEIETQ